MSDNDEHDEDLAEKPPPYSYSLALSINPEWDRMYPPFPFLCSGRASKKWPHANYTCNRDVTWWHPLTPPRAGYCDRCCPTYYKQLYVTRWRETKLRLVAEDWFDSERGRYVAEALDLDEATKRNIVEIMGYLSWDFKYLRRRILFATSKKARHAFIVMLASELAGI